MIFTSMTDIATEIHAEKEIMQDSVQIEAFMLILNFNPIPCMGGGMNSDPQTYHPSEANLFFKQTGGYPISPHIKTIDVAFQNAEK